MAISVVPHSLLQRELDTRAGVFLQSLMHSHKPLSIPDCGHWNDIIRHAQKVFDAQDSLERKGQMVTAYLSSAVASKKYPGLADLLYFADDAPPPPPALPSVAADTHSGHFPALPESACVPEGLSAGACPWLDEYVIYSRAASPEGYQDFHEACGLWLLATVAGRRVKIPFSRKQYTPLMIALVARTSLYAKSNTAEAAISVLQSAGLRWLLGSDETTPQKLLTDMVGQLPKNYSELDEEKQRWIRQRLSMSAQRGWYYDEFGSLVKAMSKNGGAMSDFKGLLLKLDNCSDQYEYATLSRGVELIEKPYLSLLGSMTPSDIKATAKVFADFWSDGFWARFAFICPPPDTSIDAPFSLGELPVPFTLSKPLRDWHDRLGTPVIDLIPVLDKKEHVTGFTVNRTALPETTCTFGEGVYDAWTRYRSALKSMIRDWHNQDLDGSYQRFPMKAIRVAALLASLTNSNLIEMCHWAKAQEITERWRKSLHELYSQVNNSEIEPSYAKRIEDDILKYVRKLEDKQPPTVRDLSRYMTTVDVGKLKQGAVDLVRAGLLQEEKTSKATRYSSVKE